MRKPRGKKAKRQAVEKQRLKAKRAKGEDRGAGEADETADAASSSPDADTKRKRDEATNAQGDELSHHQRLEQHFAQLQANGVIQPPPLPSFATGACKGQTDLDVALNEPLSDQGRVYNQRKREIAQQQKALAQARECATKQAEQEWAVRVIGLLRSGELATVRVMLPHGNHQRLDYEAIFIFEGELTSRFGVLQAQNIRPATDNTAGLQWIEDRAELIMSAPSIEREQVSREGSAAEAMLTMRGQN